MPPTMHALPQAPPAAPAPAIAPAIHTRAHHEALVENIARLHAEHNELLRAQENDIAAIRVRYRAHLAEIEKFLDLETGWAEAWARAHPEALSPSRTLACAHATLGFRAEPPRVERASRRWTWSRIAAALGALDWGRRYLRTPALEVDKEAIVADLARLSPVDLRNAGLRVLQGERFFLSPHAGEPSSIAEPAWQKAA